MNYFILARGFMSDMKRTNPVERSLRRKRVATAIIKGKDSSDIALDEGLSERTIERDIQAIEKTPDLFKLEERSQKRIEQAYFKVISGIWDELQTIIDSNTSDKVKVSAIKVKLQAVSEVMSHEKDIGSIPTVRGKGINVNVGKSCDKCTILDKMIENKLICSKKCKDRIFQEDAIDVEFSDVE